MPELWHMSCWYYQTFRGQPFKIVLICGILGINTNKKYKDMVALLLSTSNCFQMVLYFWF